MAITANELRINNILSLCGEPTNISSGFIADYDFSLKNNFSDNTPIRKGDVEPIPITEEWLLKFGAVKYNGNRFYLDLEIKGTLQLFWNIGDDYFICEFSSRSSHVCYFNEHKYIHQLQNLYFALTGQELIYGNNPD